MIVRVPPGTQRRHRCKAMSSFFVVRHAGHTELMHRIQMFVGFKSCLWVFGPLLVSVAGGDAPKSASRRFP